VAALEKLKSEQQQLIALKDTELASAQQRLAAANQAATTAKAVTPAATTAQPPEQTSKSSPLPYVWGGIGVVVLALLAWLLAGRKPAKKPVRRSVFDSDALAASMKPAEAPPAQTPSFAQALDDAAAAEEPAVVEISAPAQPVADNTIDLNTVPTTPSGVTMPTWTSGWMKQDVARTGGEQPELSALATPTDETPAAEEAEPLPDAESNAAPDAAPSAELQGDEAPAQAAPEQRFKLAKAFLDMGDEFSAQQILLELLDDEDEAVGAEAARMLSKLVG
jgi:pilus assembly protein FimV